MNSISFHLLYSFCIFLEFVISNIKGNYWLFCKLQFLWHHSQIKVQYLESFSDRFQLWTWLFHDNCLIFQTKNRVYSWAVYLSSMHKPMIKLRFKWLYLIFFQFSEINVGEGFRQWISHCTAISLFVRLRLKNVFVLCQQENNLLKINLLHICGNLL